MSRLDALGASHYAKVVNQKVITYLSESFTHPVRDPLWKHIYLTAGMEKLIQTPAFSRLSRLRQLGLAYHIYPGAVHTRFNHSLGVFHLAKRIITVLLSHPDCPVLSLEGVRAFLVACLCHDLGHFPYAHVFEDSLKLLDHEALSAHKVLEKPLATLIQHDIGTDPYWVASIINTELQSVHNPQETEFYRSLLSGVLDPDKLDYLNRDAYFCGIPYGIQDTDFIISQMIPLPSYQVALASKGLMSVENVLFSKYLMYRSVYWHKGVRAPSSIIKKSLEMALNQGTVQPEDLYQLDDTNFASTLAHKDPSLAIILLAETKGNFLSIHEEDWDGDQLNSAHLLDPLKRWEIERELAQQLSRKIAQPVNENEVVIDVPRSLSFEVELPIVHHGKITAFTDSRTVFGPEVVKSFTRVLKKVRICGPARTLSLGETLSL
jgi:HD superfamily phosphohydrolase